jgi:hypothetical protein
MTCLSPVASMNKSPDEPSVYFVVWGGEAETGLPVSQVTRMLRGSNTAGTPSDLSGPGSWERQVVTRNSHRTMIHKRGAAQDVPSAPSLTSSSPCQPCSQPARMTTGREQRWVSCRHLKPWNSAVRCRQSFLHARPGMQ